MHGRNVKFEIIDNRIILIVEQLIWDKWLEVFRLDVTDEVSKVYDAYKPTEIAKEEEPVQEEKPKTSRGLKRKK